MFDGRPSDLPEVQVYTFAGFVEHEANTDAASVRSGLALALSHDQVIDQFAKWGFRVTAVSALHEVRDTLAVLESIAAGRADVEVGDFINFLDSPPPYTPAQVFSLGGHHVGSQAQLAGFAVAPDLTRLSDELAGLQFQLRSSASLAELRELAEEMTLAQEGDENVIDLVGLAIAA